MPSLNALLPLSTAPVNISLADEALSTACCKRTEVIPRPSSVANTFSPLS